jgi:hypothetical protein
MVAAGARAGSTVADGGSGLGSRPP